MARGLRIVDSEEVSKSLSKEEVYVWKRNEKEEDRDVKSLGGRSEDSRWVCIQGFGSGSERSNWECLRCHLIEVGIKIDLRGWGLLIFQESAGSINLGLGIWWRRVGREWVGVLSKGVKGISVSKRKSVRVFWGCSLIGVVLVVIEGVLVGVKFKEGMKGIRFRGEP